MQGMLPGRHQQPHKHQLHQSRIASPRLDQRNHCCCVRLLQLHPCTNKLKAALSCSLSVAFSVPLSLALSVPLSLSLSVPLCPSPSPSPSHSLSPSLTHPLV